MVDHARPEDFTGLQSGRFRHVSENAVEIDALHRKLDALQQRCTGLEAENLYLRIAAQFTDHKRREVMEMLEGFLARWKLLEVPDGD